MRQLEQRTYNNISAEDKALFRALYESYDSSDIDRYINELKLNEDHFAGVAHAQSYSQTTPGTTERGVKGLVKALPSAVISCLICPAGTLIALIGAVRERFEKRFTKSLFNLARWADFVGTPKEKKKELVEKVKREVAERTKYFMAKLANGEVIRVVACHNYEAKQMAIAIEEELIIPQEEKFTLLKHPDPSYNETKNKERDDSNDKLWLITFDDGEVQYWQASKDADKKQVIQEANKQRRFIAGGFAKKFKKVTGKKLEGIGSSYDKEYEPIKVAAVEKIEIVEDPSQLRKVADYNKENIEIYEGDRLSVSSNQNNNIVKFKLTSDNKVVDKSKEDLPVISYSLPTVDSKEMTEVTSKFFTDPNGYYQKTFLNKYYQNFENNTTTTGEAGQNANNQNQTSTYAVGTYAFGKDCSINLVYDSSNISSKNNINNLVIELNREFQKFLKNNNEIESSTKKKLEKYTFDKRTENAIQSGKSLLKTYSGPFVIIPDISKYKNAFEYAELTSPDEDGNKTTERIKLDSLAA